MRSRFIVAFSGVGVELAEGGGKVGVVKGESEAVEFSG
jgi:hypothetical protein